MALRSKRIFNRLNRARMDSSAIKAYEATILNAYEELKTAHGQWKNGGDPLVLSRQSQGFCDLCSEIFLVPPMKLSLKDRNRPHSRDSKGRVKGELFGSCTSEGRISIYLRTAARNQPTAFKTFFNTLVHEWVHHYDFTALNDSILCAGFYARVNSIYKLCVDS